MTRKLISVFKYVVLLAIAFGLLALAFKGVDVKKTFQEISEVNYFWLGLSVLASLVAFVSRAYRWNMLIEPLGYHPKLKNTTYSLMVGYLANLAFPRAGEVTRCGSLSKAEKLPFDALFGTVIAERLIDAITLLGCIIITAVVEYDRLGNFLFESIINPMKEKAESIIHSPNFILIVVVAVVVLVILFFIIKKKSAGHPFTKKILNLINGVISGLRTVGKLNNPLAFLFHTVLIWAMYFLMAYVCFFSLPATTSLTMGAGLFVLVAGGIGMSAPVQGGLGAYHLLVSQGLMLFGLSKEHGLVFATLLHTSQALVVMIAGGISFLLLFLSNKKNTNDNTGNIKVETT